MTPDKDSWIKHDGGNNPVSPDSWVQIVGRTGDKSPSAKRADYWYWDCVAAYRVFAPVTPGPSPFVRETAAQIMASAVTSDSFLDTLDEGDTKATLDATAAFAVRAALALEAELGRIGK